MFRRNFNNTRSGRHIYAIFSKPDVPSLNLSIRVGKLQAELDVINTLVLEGDHGRQRSVNSCACHRLRRAYRVGSRIAPRAEHVVSRSVYSKVGGLCNSKISIDVASKVIGKNYAEVWWFYPRGDSTECNDAIIYNVRENTWYDAGQALGARRSAGYFSQVFAYPVAANWDTSEAETVFTDTFNEVSGSEFLYLDTYNSQVAIGQVISGSNIPTGTEVVAITTINIKTLGAITAGSGYVDGVYTNVPLTGGEGSGAEATISVVSTAVATVTITALGAGYEVGDSLTCSNANLGGTGSGFSIPVSTIYAQAIEMSDASTGTGAAPLTFSIPAGLIEIYQHEIGTDEINGQNVKAIPSFFETNDLSWLQGGPSQPTPEGPNRWTRLERVEPDFLLSGQMELYITGRPFAQSEDATTGPYVFEENTGKIDMKEQRRELRMKFVSNVAGGNYQLGKVVVNADFGDVRGYGS